MQDFLRWIYLVLLTVSFAACGGSAGSDSTATTDDSTEDLAVFMEWSGAAWNDVNALMDGDKTLTLPQDCPGGGTMEEDGDEIALNDCVVESDTATYLGRGTYQVTTSGSLVTHSWDQDLLVNDEISFSSTGSISFDTINNLVAFDFSATFDSGTYHLAGIVDDSESGTSDLTLTVADDGTDWLDCSFADTDLSTLTQEAVEAACEDDDDECDTFECANDFQCQLFADDDPDDEFTTGNTQCVSGCCSIVETESSCDDNTITCSDNFSCQLFADDDTTDEFETDNVECGEDGCCIVF